MSEIFTTFAFVKLKDAVRRQQPGYKNPARYRLDFIKENTFNRVWTLRMTRTRVALVSSAIIAGSAALIWVIIAYTPVRQFLPGALKGDLRADYIAAALTLDSLEQVATTNAAYIASISAAIRGEIAQPDTSSVREVAITDSLLAASEAEKQFVMNYEAQERFNLSVLTPIAAEAMVFSAPAGTAATVTPLPAKAMQITGPKNTPVTAVYRGTVVSSVTDSEGKSTVTVQHPNDFVSVYSGLDEVFVDRGNKVVAGQRLGHATGAMFELWHNGSALNPEEYINI